MTALLFCEFNKFDLKIEVIPNRLVKYMAFFNKNLMDLSFDGSSEDPDIGQ